LRPDSLAGGPHYTSGMAEITGEGRVFWGPTGSDDWVLIDRDHVSFEKDGVLHIAETLGTVRMALDLPPDEPQAE
jgi:hypothetical protein